MKIFTNSNDENTSLGIAERTAYGLGNFGNGFMFFAIAIFLTYFYTDVIGLNASVIGGIMLFSRVFDGVTDLVMGYIVDHTKESKFGKTRLWMLRSVIPFAISGVVIFMIPQNASDMLKYVYVFVSYNLCNSILYTMVTVPYNSLMVRITRNSMERGILGIFLMFLSSISSMAVGASCLVVVDFFGNDAAAWTKTIAVYSVIGLVAHMLCIFGTRERVQSETENTSTAAVETPGFIESFKILLQNRYWLTTTIAWLVFWIGYTMSTSGHLYFAQYIMGNEKYQPIMTTVIDMVNLAAMLLAYIPMRKFGKGACVRIGAFVMGSGFFLLFFCSSSFPLLIVSCIVQGAGMALFLSVIGGLTPDNLDYSEWKSGKNVTGMGCAAVSFGQKVGTGLGGAIFGLILGFGGYDGLAAVQTSSAIWAIKMDYIAVPVLCSAISLLLLWKYDLDKKIPQIEEELEKRHAL